MSRLCEILSKTKDVFKGVAGAITFALQAGIKTVNAVEKWSPIIRGYVREAAIIVEAVIPDATPEARLFFFDRLMESYIALDDKINATTMDEEMFAAARMLLEGMLLQKKVEGGWTVAEVVKTVSDGKTAFATLTDGAKQAAAAVGGAIDNLNKR